jgi:hypothetical protein
MTLVYSTWYRPPERPGEYGTCGDGRDKCLKLFLEDDIPWPEEDQND